MIAQVCFIPGGRVRVRHASVLEYSRTDELGSGETRVLGPQVYYPIAAIVADTSRGSRVDPLPRYLLLYSCITFFFSLSRPFFRARRETHKAIVCCSYMRRHVIPGRLSCSLFSFRYILLLSHGCRSLENLRPSLRHAHRKKRARLFFVLSTD